MQQETKFLEVLDFSNDCVLIFRTLYQNWSKNIYYLSKKALANSLQCNNHVASYLRKPKMYLINLIL